MNISNERKMGAVLSYLSIFIESLTTLLYTPFLIKMIGQAEYGLYSLVSSVIGYLTVLDFGLGNALIVYTAKYNAKQEYEELKKIHGMFFILFMIIGIITGILGFILFLNVDNLFGNTMTNTEITKAKIMMLILTFNLVVSFPLGTYTSIIRAHEKFVFIKTLSILRTIFNPIFMIPLLLLGYKSVAMTVVLTFINLTSLLLDYFYCKYKLKIKIKYNGFDFVIFRGIVGYSFFIFLGTIVDKINWNVDQFILGSVSGTIAVSIYSIASRLNTMFIYLSTAMSGILLPKISSMIAKRVDQKDLSNEFIKIGRIQCYIVFLIVSGLVLFGKEFIKVWVGPEFITSYYVTLILVIPLSFTLLQNLAINISQAQGKYRFIALSTLFMSVFNVFISYYLAKSYGAVGSATGTAIALIGCNLFVLNIYYYRTLKLDVIQFWREIIKMFIPFALPIMVILSMMRIIHLTGLTYLIVFIPIYVVLFSLVSYLFVMNDYEKNLVNGIFVKFKRKKI